MQLHGLSTTQYMYFSRLVNDASKEEADCWVINTCTVKNPSQAAMSSLVAQGRALGKSLVVAGCVPQGDKKIPELQDLSLLGTPPDVTVPACFH